MPAIKTELKAEDIMTAQPVCVEPATTLQELARVFDLNDISGAPVVDQQGRVVGIVSKTDLIRRCAQGLDDMPPGYLFEILAEQDRGESASEVLPEVDMHVEDFMTEDPLTVGPSLSVLAVARLMFDRRVHRVVVADDEGFPLGIITSMDLIGALPRLHS